jgi:peptidoglycan/xylan/chitin deacetylase (PgdA/CDA1 family)
MTAAFWIAVGASAAGAAVHGALHRNSPVFGRVQYRLRGSARRVALTFDDGPNPRATAAILDTLARERVPATFFLLGRHVDRWPDLVRRASTEGHELANHGYVHEKMIFRSPSFVRADISRGMDAIERAAGVRPRRFRAPHGARNPWVSPIAHALGQQVTGWTLGVWDTDRPGADVIARRVTSGVSAGAIVLLHDGDGYDPDGDRMQTAEALPEIIRVLRERGYTFTTLGAAE